MSIRICWIIPTLDEGGAEKQLCLLAKGIDRRRFEPLVVTLTRDGPRRSGLGSTESRSSRSASEGNWIPWPGAADSRPSRWHPDVGSHLAVRGERLWRAAGFGQGFRSFSVANAVSILGKACGMRSSIGRWRVGQPGSSPTRRR